MNDIAKAIRVFENRCSHAWANDENVSLARGRALHAAVDEARSALEALIENSIREAKADGLRIAKEQLGTPIRANGAAS